MIRRRDSAGFMLAAVLLSPALLSGCSSEDPVGTDAAPVVELAGGPVEGSEVAYRIRLWWTARDDGRILLFQYALDPPAAFTEEELSGVGPELHVEHLPAAGGEPPRTRVSKTVGGETVSFDWIHTADFSRRFTFTTTEPESTETGGVLVPEERYTGTHAFYVRALDDAGNYSAPARVGFTAATVTPVSTIVTPPVDASVLQLGQRVSIGWESVDPDAPDGAAPPASYLYKLVNLDLLVPPPGILTSPTTVFYEIAANQPWIPIADDSVVLDLASPARYMFAVRGVDVAGGIEPFLMAARSGGAAGNVLRFTTSSEIGQPRLTVSDPVLGTFTSDGAEFAGVDVPLGFRMNLSWFAVADHYGGIIRDFNWAVDPADPQNDEEWMGWTPASGPGQPILIDREGMTRVYVRVRDYFGTQTLLGFNINGIVFSIDRPILIVDDVMDTSYPTDAQRDGFWLDLLENSGRFDPGDADVEVALWNTFGPADITFSTPVVPSLIEMSRYELIVFDTRASGRDGRTGLLEGGAKSKRLALYLAGGGKLWVTGEQTVAATLPRGAGVADVNYPHDLDPGDFAYDFLRLYTDRVENRNYVNGDRDGLHAVRPYPGSTGAFADMVIDSRKQNPVLRDRQGVGGCDVIFSAILENLNPGHTGTIDSLYAFESFGSLTPPGGSSFDGRPCAIRWSDPDPSRPHGRTMWFGFPMYYFETAQAQKTFNRAVDWFREESPPAR